MTTPRAGIRALAAAAGVVGILVGIPTLLWLTGGSPLPSSLPALSDLPGMLLRPDDGGLFIGALKLVGWLGWLSYAIPLLVELAAAIARVRAPQMPGGLRMQQRQVAALVAAMAALGAGASAASAAPPPAPAPAPVTATSAPIAPTATPSTAPTSSAHTASPVSSAPGAPTTTAPPSAPRPASDTTRETARSSVTTDRKEQVGARTHSSSPRSRTAPQDTAQAARTVEVKRGDTLWKLAEHWYGDGRAWHQIATASAATEQADGNRLEDPDVIYPGWKLTLPAAGQGKPAPASSTSEVPRNPPGTTGKKQSTTNSTTSQSPRPSSSTSPRTTPSATATTAENSAGTPVHQAQVPQPTAPSSSPAPSTSAAATATATATATASSTPTPSTTAIATPPTATPPSETSPKSTAAFHQAKAQQGTGQAVATVAGLGSLAAAGMLTALAMRRRRQERHRQLGQRVPVLSGDAAVAEAQMRAAADPISVDVLDRALRTLAANARGHQQTLPTLRAAKLTQTALELYLTDETDTLPAPFTPAKDAAAVWVLSRHNLSALIDPDQAREIPAPWPTLVSVGVDDDGGHLLLNLEEIGSLGLTGEPALCHEVLTAMAIDLITASWRDNTRITLVGLMPELVHVLGTDTATYCDDVEQAHQALTYAAHVHRTSMRRSGHSSLATARTTTSDPDTWTPHLLLVSTDLDDTDRERLQELARDIPRVAIATITAGIDAIGDWSLRITGQDEHGLSAELWPIRLRVTPQHLSLEDYDSYIAAFRACDQPLTGPTDVPSAIDNDPDNDEPAYEVEPPLRDLFMPVTTKPDTAEETTPADGTTPAPTNIPTLAEAKDSLEELEEIDTGRGDYEHERVDQVVPAGSSLAPTAANATALEELEPTEGEPARLAPEEESAPDLEELAAPAAMPRTPLIPIKTTLHRPPAGTPAQILDSVTTTHAPVLRLLGTVEIRNARGPKPASHGRSLELITYLGLHPSDNETGLTEALFPGQRAEGGKLGAKRNKYVAAARRWLGTNDDGAPYLPMVQTGGYRLNNVAVDWDFFRDLTGTNPATADTSSLRTALGMVEGRPVSGIDQARWAWAQTDINEMIAAVADTAHELATRSLDADDPRTASWAAEKGLAAEPVSEMLWRDLITAATQLGNPNDAITRYHAMLDDLEADPEPSTLNLINQTTTNHDRATVTANN